MDRKMIFKDLFGKKGYKLDLRFMIDDGNDHPLAILVPGGGYQVVCSFVEGTPIARKLNEKGISAAIVYYATRNKGKCPKPIDDLARGVKEVLALKDRYHLDIDHYSLWGASAGGHLAAEFCSDNLGADNYDLPKPDTLVLSYPVVTMDRKYTHMGSHDTFIGKDAVLIIHFFITCPIPQKGSGEIGSDMFFHACHLFILNRSILAYKGIV